MINQDETFVLNVFGLHKRTQTYFLYLCIQLCCLN